MARRASRRVTLVLIGSAALHGCGEPDLTPQARDTYLSQDACAADWGRPENCERQEFQTAAGHSVFFRGPIYAEPSRDQAQTEAREAARRAGASIADTAPTNRSVGRTTIASGGGKTTRGGFGSIGRRLSIGS